MSETQHDHPTTRRSFLRGTAAGAAGLALARLGIRAGVAEETARAYGPFKMGIQSYSLRGYPLEEALARTRQLGLGYWEAYNDHMPLTESAEQLEGYRKKLQDAGVKVMAYGVVGFGAEKERARHVFTFAKAMGIETISADPTPDALGYLDGLVEEFGINVAIHNHGPGSRYDKISQVQAAIQGRNHRIGACVDTGHYLHSDEDPVEAIRRFGDRVYGVHLKDVTADKHFTELGKGSLKLSEALKLLKDLKYQHCLALEYEEHPRDPIPGIQECLAAVRAAVAKGI
jgi:inosose dehydratase